MSLSIRNIWAVGRNYTDHAKELGNAVPSTQSEPMIFLKAGSCAVSAGEAIRLPHFTTDIHHEVELAFQFGPGLRLDAMTIALDLTAREVQTKLKAQSYPWTLAKSFQASCPIGPMKALPVGLELQNIHFSLAVNGEPRQRGWSGDMIHSVDTLRAYVVDRFPVCEGDLLLTGTPKGVARINSGDRLVAVIEGLLEATWTVA